MRYEDASHTGAFQGQGPVANDDTDQLAAGSKSSATGNLISGEGTQTGSTGADVATGGHITAIAGKGGEDSSFAGGKLSVLGEYGKLSVDAEGNYVYQANKGVENVRDRFTYTLADNNGASDTASLVVEIGKTPLAIKADAQQIVVGPDGVVTLPAGVELSDVHVVGRNLVVDMPDGTQLIILDGAIFVPQLVLGGVEVPSTNVAALLIGQEVAPAAGENVPSSGGNFAVPPPPLDPGVPLGDLIPPTEYNYIPPEPQEVLDQENAEPEAGAAFAQLDDDAQDDGNPGGVGDDPGSDIAEGFLPGSGGDGDLTFDLQPSGTLPNGTFSFADQPNGDVWILQNGLHVLTISVEPSTGAYTVTQVAAIDHPAGGDENNLDFTIDYTVTDEDGDVDAGTLTVNVDDDTPIAIPEPEQITGLVDEDDLPSGNHDNADGDDDPGDADGDGDGTTTSGAAGSLLGLFSFGADQPGSSGLGTDTSGMTAQGLSSNGVALTYVVAGDTLTASAGGETIFTLTVNADGSWTFDLEGQLDHDVVDTEDNLDIDFSSMIVGTDHDGDTASLPDDTFVITVDDDLPVPVGERQQVTGLVDEDDLPAGNHDDADGDDDPGNADGDNDGTTTGGDEGSLTGLFSFGADQPGTVELSSDTSGLPALTSNNVAVTYSVVGNVLTASAGGSPVFTLTVNPDGSWVFDLQGQLDHEIAGTEDNLFLDFSSIIIGVDADGDTAGLPAESFVVNVDDDMPQEFEDCPDDVISINDPNAEPFTGSLNLPPVGADDPGVVTFGVSDGDPVLDTEGHPVTSGEDALFYFINDDGVLEARVGDETGDLIFTITLNGDGTFTYDQVGQIGIGGTISFDNFDEADAGNTNYVGLGNDDPASQVDLLMSAGENTDADPDIEDTTVNTDNDSIGAQNQSMDANDSEVLRLDFVSNLQTGGAGPTGFSFDGHVGTNSYLQLVPQVQGSQDVVAAFKVWALDSTLTDADAPDRNPTDGFSDASTVTITSVTIIDYETGETHIEDISGLANGATEVLDFGVSVTRNADGSVTFSGIQEGDQYGVATGANEFNAIVVQATDNSFDLGVFSIGIANEFEPVDLSVPVILTDADGDPVTCDIDIHIGEPLEANDVTVTVNEAGLPIIGSDAASDSETQGGDLQGQVSGGTGPYTFAFAPGESGDGTYGTLTLNPDGTYSYTLETPFDSQPDADDGTNPELNAESFDVVATDSEGATQTITIHVNIIDDVPSIDVTADDDSEVELVTHDALTIGGDSDDASSSADFSGVFGFTSEAGADGAAVTPDLDYELGISAPGVDSQLNQGGANIYLYLIGGVVIGSTSATEGGVLPGNTVFDVTVSDTGVVTLTQYSQIDHPVQGGLNDAPFDDQIIALADGLVTLTASASIIDNDGDTDEDSATVNIGANLQFADHGPVATNDVDNIAAGFYGTATGNVMTGSEVAVAEDTNGQDGNADTVGADTPGRVSLVSFEDPITHVVTNVVVPDGGSAVINGTYGVLTIYSNGDYSYDRNDGSAGGVSDVFTYTLRDFDGDTDTATLTINIGINPPVATTAQAAVDDDGLGGANPLGSNDINANTQPNPDDLDGSGSSEASFRGQLGVTGGDGDIDFSLIAPGAGIVVGQETVTISGTAALLTATITASPDATRIGDPLFTVSLNQETGEYTVTLVDNILHGDDANNDEDGTEVQVQIQYQVVDVGGSDSDSPGVLTISFNDDVPTANNDTANQATENQAFTIDCLANDVFGADGVNISDATKVVIVSNATQGVVTYSTTTHLFTYTPNAEAGSSGTSDSFTYKIIDADGDESTATVNITLQPDSTPSATAEVAFLDDDGLTGGNALANVNDINANTGGDGDSNGSEAIWSGTFNASFGADTPGSFSFANTITGTTAVIGQETVTYTVSAGGTLITANITASPDATRIGDPLFTVQITNQATGAYTVTLVDNVLHATRDTLADDDTENTTDPTAVLQFTATDSGGVDSTTGNLTITFDDDMSSINLVTDATGDNVGPTPTAEGDFAYSIGADNNTDFDDISIDPTTFVISINGTPLDAGDVTFGEALAGEDAHTAEYEFSFTYPTGEGGDDTINGTLIFYKDGTVAGHDAGTYEVVLDGAVSGFTILQTSDLTTSFVEYDLDGGSPDVVTAQLADNLYAQFTAVSTNQNGTQHLLTTAGDDVAWDVGELFTADPGNPQVSHSDAGVDGNTMDTGEVLDFDLFTTDPTDDLTATADGFATEMFMQFFQYAAGDDIIVILKLQDANDPSITTTRAILIDAADVFTDADTVTGTYATLVAGLGSQDALVVIQSNDYNADGENWVITGAQIVTDNDTTTGIGINLNGDLGDAGASDTNGDGFFTGTETQNFSTDTDVSGLKITSIGFLVPDTTNQSVTIDFEATVTDADGDSDTAAISVQIGDPVAPLAPLATLAASSETSSGDSSFSNLSFSNDNSKLGGFGNGNGFGGGNNLGVTSAMVAASGFAAMSTTALQSFDQHSLSSMAHEQMQLNSARFSGHEDLGGSQLSAKSFGHETMQLVSDAAPVTSGHNFTSQSGGHVLDVSSAIHSAPTFNLNGAADHGPAIHAAVATSIAPTVAMVSAQALQAANLAGHGEHSSSTAGQIVAEVLAQGNAPAVVDAVLNAIHGGNGGDAALVTLASHAGTNVPAWDMAMQGAFGPGSDMMMKMGAELLHQDAVQPTHNG